ncbi:MAG: apolipoprotein N-acyltransferase [Elusimicrobia bacterium]|nr:apolipoprotein N-acyltransferase [Elusimicrobiota bacterium]
MAQDTRQIAREGRVVVLVSCAMCLASSFLLFLSFPPAGLWPLAWVALVPLFFVLEGEASVRRAFLFSFLTGFLFFLLSLQWIHYVTVPGWILLSAYLGVYFGCFGLLHSWAHRMGGVLRLVILACGWVVLEGVRGTFLTGFNWGSLGHSQAPVPFFIGIASWAGVAGVSFVLVLFNLVLVSVLPGKNGISLKKVGGLFLALVLVWGGAGSGLSLSNLKSPRLRVAMVQANIPLSMSWSPSLAPMIVRRHLSFSREALLEQPDLIIWPESSFPNFLWDFPELFDQVKAFARESKVPLLIGAVTKEGGRYFNSALLISPDGNVADTYDKRHLVLFGEYIPLRETFPFLSRIVPIDDFTPGTSSTVLTLPDGTRVGVLICFEDTVPGLARRAVRDGAQVLINITNDAWFRDSGQPRMHLYNALFRAVENGRPLVRVTNTGESCAISDRGRLLGCIEDGAGRRVGVSGVRVVDVVLPREQETIYTKCGELFAILCFLIILGTVISIYVKRGAAPWRKRSEGS